jgi:2-haloacid dehalogenase
MRPVLLFDVNETLLDLRALDPIFDRVFGDRAVRTAWFTQMLQVAFVGTITAEYIDFTTAQVAALRMLAERQRVELSSFDSDEVVGAMSRLPAHSDAAPALERLRSAGYRLGALTNSVLTVAEAQLLNAGLRPYFEHALSADTVRRLKPAAEPYRMAADVFGVRTGNVCLVAAHPWDISGALAAGCQAAFVARSGAVPTPLGRAPNLVVGDLADLAEVLTTGHRSFRQPDFRALD